METVYTRTISLLTTDIKSCKLISVNREIMKEALKSLKIVAKVLARRRNDMGDILLLATGNTAKDLAGAYS